MKFAKNILEWNHLIIIYYIIIKRKAYIHYSKAHNIVWNLYIEIFFINNNKGKQDKNTRGVYNIYKRKIIYIILEIEGKQEKIYGKHISVIEIQYWERKRGKQNYICKTHSCF